MKEDIETLKRKLAQKERELVRHAVEVNKLASIQVKGRVQPVQTYEVIGLK